MQRRGSEDLTPGVWVWEGMRALAESGESGVKIDVIAKRLNITRGSFYWHFRNRKAYLEAILDEWLRITGIIQAYLARQDLEPELRLAFALLFAVQAPTSFAPGGQLDQALDRWAFSSPRVAEIVQANHRARLEYLERQFARMGRGQPHILAEAFYSSIIGCNRLSTRPKADTIEVVKAVVDLFGLRLPWEQFDRMHRELDAELKAEAAVFQPTPT